jgi:protein SCO1/2
MNKTAWLGLGVALFLPLMSYWLVKGVGENATPMPRKYFADSVVENQKNGKTTFDTVWHKIPDFQLTDHLGNTLRGSEMEGRIWVVNTFFTRCPNICPGLTRNIRKMQLSFENPKRKKFGDTSIVYFLSMSVDPERDSVAALKRWADRFHVNSDSWKLLTGSKKDIYNLLLHDFRLSAQDGEGIDSNFIHTEKVMLIDRNMIVRGYYNGLDSASMANLGMDIGRLYLEKDRTKPSIFREYIPILPVLAFVPLIIILGMWFLNRTRKRVERIGNEE